ncbi:MAG TPA: hypothetical protein VH744_12000 [Terriglobales bacterium]
MSKAAMNNFLHALAAVQAGNAAYFLLMPYLPRWAQHVIFHNDLGLLVDFALCLGLFLIIKTAAARNRPPHAKPRN